MEPEPDRIELVDIETEMRAAYLDYAMSVITSRALPDVRDGMKPVQRRILYAMYDAGLRPDRPFRKSATTVGDVLGKYHPHGDSAVYDAMVRLAQGFSMRYPLVDGQGNFGSVDGDPAAAHRYTEARPTVLAMEMLADIDAETVDMRPNFDDSRTEPEVMPARVPNLLVNGASGIAVGMATNIPPHNLGEVCDALVFLLDQRQRAEEVTVEELMRHMPGPDFPTGASILGREGIRNAYATGRGRVVMRATTHIEELRDGRLAIVVDEIPFQVNKATLVERIADLARSKRIDTISDLRDETDRRAMRVVIELRRGADPHVTLNRLLKYSSLQQTFGVNMLALVDGEPRLLPLRKILWHYLEHREDVVRRRSEHQLARARARAHVLEGLLVALANLDAVIETIRRSDDAADARSNLQTRFGLSEIQAQAILDMQLRRLAALERQHIEDEHRELAVRIAELETLLADEERLMAVVRADLLDLKAAYADERRTRIEIDGDEELGDDDLVADQDVLITISERGYIKRVPTETYRSQGRGGRGIRGATTREDDAIRHNVFAGTRDVLLFFSDRGRVYELPAYAVPATGREAAGTPIVNLIQIAPNERVTVALAVPRWQFAHGSYLVMATRRGRVKRTRLSEYTGVRRSGLIGINLEQGDTLCWAKITTGDDDLIMVTRRGLAIRFLESEVRPMGRAASGVRGIRLRSEDEVASLDVVRPQADLLVVTTLGYGKRTPLSSYPRKGRGGLGVRTMDASRLSEVGEIADARVVDDGNEVALVTDLGIVMRTVTDAISRMGRSTRGVRVMRLDAGHRLATMALLADRKPPEGLGDEGGEGTSDPEDDADDGSGLSGDEDEFGVAGDDDVSDGADDGDDPDEDAEDGFGDEPDDDAEDGFGDDPDEDADDDFGDDDPEDDTPEDDPPEEEL